MKSRIAIFLLLALQVLVAFKAHAEKGDSEQTINVVSDAVSNDDVKQIRTFTGNVILTQGTLIMKGTKLIINTTPDGWNFATLYAPPNGLATMRQKRDGGPDLWMEGEASERITYDEKTGVASMYQNAKARRMNGKIKTDEATGPFLTYNGQTEIVTGAMSPNGDVKDGVRPTVAIQPQHRTNAAPAPAPAASTAPADTKGK